MEIARIFEQWQLNDAPDELILKDEKGEFNGKIMAQYLVDKSWEFTRENLTKAYEACKGKLLLRQPVVVEKIVEKPVALQTPQEAQTIRLEWWKSAPKNLPYTPANDAALSAYIQKHFGMTNRTSLQEAFDHAPLQRLSTAEIQAEAANKEQARQRRDYLESLKVGQTLEVQNRNAQKAALEKKDALQKELKNLQSQIEQEISNYQVTNPHVMGAPDYARTESGRDSLRSVRDEHDRSTIANAKVALSAVRARKAKL